MHAGPPLNGSGSLRVQITGTGERTALAGITRFSRSGEPSIRRLVGI